MTVDPTLRAGDADRDATAERLRAAHGEGRLTAEELYQRLDATFAARTLGDLEALTRDLPPVATTGTPARTGDEAALERGSEVSRHSGPGRTAWGTWASVVLVCTAIWFASGVDGGDFSNFWPVWVAVPWGAILLSRAIGGPRRR